MSLPADTHVHSEYSWDTGGPTSPTATGSMQRTCERAVKIGLPAVVFTDHLDLVGWQVDTRDLLDYLTVLVGPDGTLVPPALDVDGYLECIERCRQEFPDLQILTGVEFGQPHRDRAAAAQLLDISELDRVNGSLHTLQVGEHRYEPPSLYRLWPADKVIWEYLAEVSRMIEGSDAFEVLTHIDYAVRYWPEDEIGPFDPKRFEGSFRHAMRTLAHSERALEMNVGGPLRPWIPQWWSEEGGRAITFGSDAHQPHRLAGNFPEAVAMVEYVGFRPGRHPADFWTR
ncbi:MAG: PHP domain-containing protein [Mycobacteriales bacterium]